MVHLSGVVCVSVFGFSLLPVARAIRLAHSAWKFFAGLFAPGWLGYKNIWQKLISPLLVRESCNKTTPFESFRCHPLGAMKLAISKVFFCAIKNSENNVSRIMPAKADNFI